jgi:hypothetical protein
MTSKFKLGQVWADRTGDEWVVTEINTNGECPVIAKKCKRKVIACFLANGRYHRIDIDNWDLITLIKDVEDSVSDATKRVDVVDLTDEEFKAEMKRATSLHELEAKLFTKTNKLPPKPVPGQFYRTINNSKVEFICKVGHDWVYKNNNRAIAYNQPYAFFNHGSHPHFDIIAPWTDPLPAMEIKRWAIVAKIDLEDDDGVLMKRGEYIYGYDSEDAANKNLRAWSNSAWYEIVELTGTLPAREV